MKEYVIVSGSNVKDVWQSYFTANTVSQAVSQFRKKYGFNHIKIQYVLDVETNEKYIMDYRKGWIKF